MSEEKKYTLKELKEKFNSRLMEIDTMESFHVKNKTLNYPKYYEGYRDALKMLYTQLAINEGLKDIELK